MLSRPLNGALVAGPSPLTGLESLGFPASVWVVEEEEDRAALQEFFPQNPVVCWDGGDFGIEHTDWGPLKGRKVILYPRADDMGRDNMMVVAHYLRALAGEVSMVDPIGVPLGWGPKRFLAQLPEREDGIVYLRNHIEAVVFPPPSPRDEPDPEPPEVPQERREPPPATTGLPKVQKSAPVGSQTYEQGALPDSLPEVYGKHGFLLKASGAPYCNQFNVGRGLAVRGGEVYFDQFTHKVMAGGAEWSEQFNLALTDWLQSKMGMYDLKPHIVFDGVSSYAHAHSRHPLKEWLEGLTWDGVPRLPDLLPIGFGAVRSDYTEAVGRCFMVGMVARVLEPGCQLDSMPVFEGYQGVGKTSGLRIVGGKYFAEIHESFNSKDFYLAIEGKMLCEISELSAFKRSEIVLINGIITTKVDRYRAPYERVTRDHPRACVFAGTTNHDDWITDETGARRFWPVRCGEVNREWLTEQRDQYFAEAVARFEDGEDWWQVPASVEDQRAARRDVDPWEELMRPYMDANTEARIDYIIDQILSLKAHQMEMVTQKRVGKILRQNGFENRVRRDGKRTTRLWIKV